MKRLEWLAKMALGAVCYAWFMASPNPIKETRIHKWAISWAGFFAHDTGFDDWIKNGAPCGQETVETAQ